MLKATASVLVIVLALAATVASQTTNASLTGRITDPDKAIIVGVHISVTNLGTGVTYQGETNSAGTYYVTNLPTGTYRMEIEKNGFHTVTKSDIALHVQDIVEIDFEMALGSTSEIVSVTAGATNIQTTTSDISNVVVGSKIRELPLNGRSWTDLANLEPGVNGISTQPQFAGDSNSRGNRGFGAQISIHGSRPTENNYRLDGISLNDFSNAGPGGVLGGNLGVDAVQEFSILTANYSAEYGKTSGGVINAVTRSGTNQFHGSAYEFIRNSALDTRNYFDPDQIPSFRRNQFGASAGGPIFKDRTFFFADFEAVRQFTGVSATDLVPSAAADSGHLCSVPSNPTACIPTTVTVDPSAQKYLTFFPLPNNGLAPQGNGDTGFYTFTSNEVLSENFFTTRLDHHFSDKDSISGTFVYDRNPYSTPDGLNQITNGFLVARKTLALQETHTVNEHFVNAARFGFNRVVSDNLVGVSAINPAAADQSLAMIPGYNPGQVSISGGFPTFSGGVNSGGGRSFFWNSFQFYDDASLTHGAHTIKFGAAIERMQQNEIAYDIPGKFSFTSLTNFLTNVPKQFQANLGFGSRHFRQSIFAGYIQDDWRVGNALSLNMGLRYEMSTVMSEMNGELSNLINLTDSTPVTGNQLTSNPTLYNFEPRVGFAWQPFHNGKTSVRGGFGLYDVLPLIYQFFVNENTLYPFGFRTIVSAPPGSFYQGGTSLIVPNSFTVEHVDDHPARSYVTQWNLSIEHQITQNLTLETTYVGTRGIHQPFKTNTTDGVLPILTDAGYLYPAPVGSGTKYNPNFGNVQAIFYDGRSYYDGLLVGLNQNLAHGLQFKTSFTWSKSIDTGSASAVGNFFDNSLAAPPWWDIGLSRGLSDFDIRRNLVFNVVWQVPNSGLSGPAGWFTKGWELGSILNVHDGIPFTPTYGTGGDPEGNRGANSYGTPDRLFGSGCNTAVNPGNASNYIKASCFTVPTAPDMAFWTANCDTTSKIYGPTPKTTAPYPICFNLRGDAARNSLIGPGLVNLDFSLFKNIYSKERFNVQFRAEAFNVMNRSNFVGPATANGFSDIFDANGNPSSAVGKLTATSTTSRQLQFALKFTF